MNRVVIGLLLCGCGRIDFDPLSDAGLGCPETYPFDGTGCYRFVINMVEISWPEAELACEADGPGAHLMIVGDAAELLVARAALAGSSNGWIGISDRITEGTYLTVTGQPAFLVWDVGQPAGQDCVQVLDTAAMGDRDCAMANDYLCEYDGVPADPAAF